MCLRTPPVKEPEDKKLLFPAVRFFRVGRFGLDAAIIGAGANLVPGQTHNRCSIPYAALAMRLTLIRPAFFMAWARS